MSKSVVVIDVETTGLDVLKDRVIEVTIHDHRSGRMLTRRLNPGCPIPPEATAIHGITDEDVADAPAFHQMADTFLAMLVEADVIGGYNVTFDLSMLAAEFDRVGIAWPPMGIEILDAYKIWAMQHPRNLANAYRHYVGEPDTEQLHSAEYDVMITGGVLMAQLASVSEEEHGVDAVSYFVRATNGRILDPAGKLAFNEAGEAVFTFGKHVGQPVLSCRGYAEWMLGSDFPESTKRTIRALFEAREMGGAR